MATGMIFRFRRKLAADWVTANPILMDGELGLEKDTKLFKFGDGVTAWNALSYPPAGATVWGSITGTLSAQTDLTAALAGKAATVHTHLLAAGATDVTITAANLNTLDDGADTTLHFHAADRARANHSGTQLAATISDFAAAVAATAAVTANTTKVSNATHTGDATGATALTLATVNANVGSFGLAGSVAQFVVNAKGLITSAANVAISIAASAISDATAAGRAMLTAATAAAQTALLDVATTTLKGLVPPPGTATGKVLDDSMSWVTPAAGAPGGSTTEVQYNNAGAFAGAADVEIEGGQLRLPAVTSPAAPASGGVKLVGVADAGRTVPAFLSQDGVAREVQSALSRGHIFANLATNAANTYTNIGLPAPTTTGTATSSNISGATSLWGYTPAVEYLVTVAATNAVAGFRPGNGRVVSVGGPSAGLGGFSSVLIWGPATGVGTATYRCAAGMTSSGLGPTDVEPSTMTNSVFMGWDAADTNIQIMHNDGTGTCTKIDLGASFPVPTEDRKHLYELALYSPKGTTQSVDWQVKDLLTLAVASGTITTNLPAATSFMGAFGYASAGGTSSVVGIALSSNYIDPLLY